MVSTKKEVDTLEMERGQSQAGLVLRHRRDGRRVYEPGHKRAIVAQCLQPGVSVAGIALSHGINANLVRKWIVKHQREAIASNRAVTPGAALVPVTVAAASSSPAARGTTPSSLIVIELHGVRIEVAGTVDAQALRTVMHVIASVAAS